MKWNCDDSPWQVLNFTWKIKKIKENFYDNYPVFFFQAMGSCFHFFFTAIPIFKDPSGTAFTIPRVPRDNNWYSTASLLNVRKELKGMSLGAINRASEETKEVKHTYPKRKWMNKSRYIEMALPPNETSMASWALRTPWWNTSMSGLCLAPRW